MARVRAGDLTRPTPCAGWDLKALLAHVIGQHHGFAAALEQGDAPASGYGFEISDPAELQAAWTRSAECLTAAIGGAPEARPVRLVEFGPDAVFPVDTVVGFHLLDTTVHTWDIAAGLSASYRPDDELVRATATVAAAVPTGASRTRPGAAFGPELPCEQADPWVAVLARLGRSAARSADDSDPR